MALAEVSFFSRSIELNTRMMVILPNMGKGPFPVFYLLHGLSDDCTAWVRKTSIERYMAGVPMMVVMPETGRGWYNNSATRPEGSYSGAYEDHLIKDVVGFVDRVFPTIARREGRAIGGLSMGGYGAVKTALKFPEMFCSANSHSGAVMTPLYKMENLSEEQQAFRGEFEAVFGTNWRGGADDPVALAAKCPVEKRPALRVDCGVEDFLLEQSRDFHAALEGMEYAHEYEEFEGTHDWAYWDEHVQEAIAFHRRVLGV